MVGVFAGESAPIAVPEICDRGVHGRDVFIVQLIRRILGSPQVEQLVQAEFRPADPELLPRKLSKANELICSGCHVVSVSEMNNPQILSQHRLGSQNLRLRSIAQRTRISRTEISRLETAANKNPTINSLQRIASALGKELVVSLR